MGFVLCSLVRCWAGKSMCASTSASLSSMNAPSSAFRAAKAPGPLAPELVGDVAQRLAGVGAVGLDERLPERGRSHALLALGHVGQGVPHPVHDPNTIDALR